MNTSIEFNSVTGMIECSARSIRAEIPRYTVFLYFLAVNNHSCPMTSIKKGLNLEKYS